MRGKRKRTAFGLDVQKMGLRLCFLVCVASLLSTIGCAKPFGLADVDASGSMKIVKLENVSSRILRQATLDALTDANLEVVEAFEQPEFNVYVIKARSQSVGKVKVRIKTLSETSQELVLFTSSEEGVSKERDFNQYLRQEIENNLSSSQ